MTDDVNTPADESAVPQKPIDPSLPNIGRFQNLPNPEEPPGYTWQFIQDRSHSQATVPVTPSNEEQVADSKTEPSSPHPQDEQNSQGPSGDTEPHRLRLRTSDTSGEKAESEHFEDQPTVPGVSLPSITRKEEGYPPRKVIPPAGGRDGLPRKVDEVDLSATIATPAALQVNRTGEKAARKLPAAPPARAKIPAMNRRKPTRPRQQKKPGFDYGGCLVKVVVILLFMLVLGVIFAGIVFVYQYYTIASTLPSVEDIRGHASQFETTRFFDRNGQVLYEMIDPNAGRRTYTPLEDISPYVLAATIATEDKEFYNHPGFDLLALVRAMVTNYTSGEVVSGASTITQQLARTLFFTPEERVEISYRRKAKEIILSSEITRRYTKDEILELYLNEINYGNLAYGIEAAAETYFNTTAKELTLAQAAFLAGLPQAPSVYDIFSNRDMTLNRNKQVLTAMYNVSKEKDCIYVSNSPQRICIEAQQAADAYIWIDNYEFKLKANPMVYPHWVTYIRYLLETMYDPQMIYRSGFRVFTTLDPHLQLEADRIVREQVEALADRHVTDGALVAIDPESGEILAMTGSADFYNEDIAGQINMALQPRQPGSSIKPLTYAAAFEKGWTPATVLWDVPSEFPPSGDPNDTRDPYIPVNYDGKFHGPVSVRSALANSYNVPAVKALEFVGIYDNPATVEADGLIAFARRLGISTLVRNDYGLSLTLGGGEVTLFDMTSAFSVFANNGRRVVPVAITRIEDHKGKIIYESNPREPEQVMRAEHAYLITSILSDAMARAPMFGSDSILNLPFPAAVKTGTTNEYRDNWTIGYTPDLVTGVWVGNADNSPMVGTSGVSGAAPIWNAFMNSAIPYLTGNAPANFTRPEGIVEKEICVYSGAEPSENCTERRRELFAFDQPPPSSEDDLWKLVKVDTWTNLKASSACEGFAETKLVLNVSDKWAKKWIDDTDQGRAWLEKINFSPPVIYVPSRECRADDPRPTLLFVGLNDGQTITTDKLDIYAVVDATKNFKEYYLEYGEGKDPHKWTTLVEPGGETSADPQKLLTWDLLKVNNGVVTLRLFMLSTKNGHAEKLLRLNLQVPTPTPTNTPTPTETPTITPTPTSTATPTPTLTLTPMPLFPTLDAFLQTLLPPGN